MGIDHYGLECRSGSCCSMSEGFELESQRLWAQWTACCRSETATPTVRPKSMPTNKLPMKQDSQTTALQSVQLLACSG